MKHTKITGILVTTLGLLIAGGCSGSSRVTRQDVQFGPARADVVKAMTFNIRVDTIIDGFHRWAQRKSAVINTIGDNAPDVFGLQEGLHRQVQDVRTALPQYGSYAVGRDDGQQNGETCAIFYRRDRFALQNSGTFWFSDTPTVAGSKAWGAIWPRICSWVRLEQKDTGSSFYIYNVHLACLSQHARQRSVELLARQIAARPTNDPFIVMGDFNMNLNNSAMKYLQNTTPRMTDAWRMINPRRKGPKLDHIPVSRGIQPLQVVVDTRKVHGMRPSDHYPVIASLRMPVPARTASAATADVNAKSTAENAG